MTKQQAALKLESAWQNVEDVIVAAFEDSELMSNGAFLALSNSKSGIKLVIAEVKNEH